MATTPGALNAPISPQAAADAQPALAPAEGAIQAVVAAASPAVRAQMTQLLTDWVAGATPQLGPNNDELTWFLSKRATVVIDKWLVAKKFAALEPVSPTGTGCIVISREAVEHCRDHRAADGVGHAGVIELLDRLFVTGNPAYAPNISKGMYGGGYVNQLAMFDDAYKALDPAAMGETPVGILELVGAPFVHLKLVTAYWTKPGSATKLRNDVLKK